jgi:hypothetical protein
MRLFKHPLRESLVLLAPGYCTRELVDENIRALGLDRSVKPAIEMNSIEGDPHNRAANEHDHFPAECRRTMEHYPDLRVVPLADEQEKLSSGTWQPSGCCSHGSPKKACWP